jgi:hypothetical protein
LADQKIVMSETAKEIIKALGEFFKPKASGAHWRAMAPKKPEQPYGYDPRKIWMDEADPVFGAPHDPALRDQLVLEVAEESWLQAVAPDLVRQRRLQVKDRFWIQCHYTSSTRIELGMVLSADPQTKYFRQARALLELRQHVGRTIHIIQGVLPGSIDIQPGYTEQKTTITRHGLAWCEISPPIDTEHSSYPIAVFD